MVDSKFFGIPFAVSGDKAAIPEGTQPSGAISYQQGYGPDYERDPATDPLAKRVPRDETNELYFQITNSLRFQQLYGVAEWYAVDDNGNPVAYPVSAIVRHAYLGGPNTLWFSAVASNTSEPGSDPSKWVSLSPAVIQSGAWLFPSVSGTGNAIVATLSPAPPSIPSGFVARLVFAAANTGAMTLNVNGFGAAPLRRVDGSAMQAGDIASAGTVGEVIFTGAEWRMLRLVSSDIRSVVAAAKSPFNVTLTSNATRTPLSSTGFVPFASGSYVKQSATSRVKISVSTNLFSAGGNSAGQMRVTVDGQTFTVICVNMTSSSNQSSPNGSNILSGITAGSKSWSVEFGRTDALSWSSVINPNSSDTSNLPASTNTSIEFSEIEP